MKRILYACKLSMVLNSHCVPSSKNAVILDVILKILENRYVLVFLNVLLNDYELLLRFIILFRPLIGHDSFPFLPFIFLNLLIVGTLSFG
jgi:hypothetical protein